MKWSQAIYQIIECKVMVIRMVNSMIRVLETIKKDQSEMKNTKSDMK